MSALYLWQLLASADIFRLFCLLEHFRNLVFNVYCLCIILLFISYNIIEHMRVLEQACLLSHLLVSWSVSLTGELCKNG